MIGNDVVDLEAAAKNSSIWRAGFLDKLFLEEEKKVIMESENPEITTWLFWTMKEAAYKAHQRRFHLPRTYRPTAFSCKLLNKKPSGKGEVRIGNFTYVTAHSIGNTHIHSIATGLQQPEIFKELHTSAAHSKTALLEQISVQKNLPFKQIHIEKDAFGVPYLYYKNSVLNIPFSLSHDGNFSAFTFALMKY